MTRSHTAHRRCRPMTFRYAVAAEGKRFLVLQNSGNAAPAPITVLTNWQSAAKKN